MVAFDHWLPYHPATRVSLTYVVNSSSKPHLSQVEMQGTARTDEYEGMNWMRGEGEGIWWIRGHHDENSPEGQALLAAYALDQCAA